MSNNIQIYGLGNALMDMEYKVAPAFLKELGIEKGVMTLIDADKEKALVNVLDQHPSGQACGGSAANTIILLAQLGARCFYSCRVAADEAGESYLRDLKNHHVQTLERDLPSGSSGKCLVFVTPDADRTMTTFLGVSQQFSEHDLSSAHLEQSSMVYLEGYLVSSPPSFKACLKAQELAKQQKIAVSLTLSDPNMVLYFREQMEQLLNNGVDLLFSNREEAMALSNANSIDEAFEKLRRRVGEVVITDGKNGCWVGNSTDEFKIPGRPVNAVDTVGAGDAFAGAYLFGRQQLWPMDQAARFANLIAGKVVTKWGPRLNDSEVHSYYQDFCSSEEIK